MHSLDESYRGVGEVRDLALAWWETVGQTNMCRQGLNAAAFILQMKNHFPADYKEKH
jgi:hypothetical protein